MPTADGYTDLWNMYATTATTGTTATTYTMHIPDATTVLTENQIVTKNELSHKLDLFAEDIARKVYKIVSEHTKLDISEEELMKLFKEN